MDQNQANEHDLQKAIDDITKGNSSEPKVNLVEEIATRFAEQAKPVPVPAPAPNAEGLPMPPVMGTAGTMGVGMTTEGAEGEMAKLKEAILRDLVPLMGKVEMEKGQKFDLYMEMIVILKDKSVIAKAHEVARTCSDESERAKKLLKLVEVINNF